MLLADKIIKLRKANGMTGEDLAEKMGVSRQAVSKWESGQALPDIKKIIEMSELFGVTTDYLLKDSGESEHISGQEINDTLRVVSKEEAEKYICERKRASLKIALATFLCIISPVALFILGAVSEIGGSRITEAVAGAIGLGILFLLVLCAVVIYLTSGFKNDEYAFLENRHSFRLESGAARFVSESKSIFRSRYVRLNVIATVLCVMSPMPLCVTSFLENDLWQAAMLCNMFFIVAIGVFLYIVAGVQKESMDRLLP